VLAARPTDDVERHDPAPNEEASIAQAPMT
jgi:hypothetical protein